jgi:hypothetical protein
LPDVQKSDEVQLSEKHSAESEIQQSALLRLYHGDSNPDFDPYFGGGKEYHDYGKGLYCVESLEMAKEWACRFEISNISYVYVYELDLNGIPNVLDMNQFEYAYWLAVLAAHRYVSKEGPLLKSRRERLIKVFPVDCESYDVIKGWRANDKYFAYLRDFLSVEITYEAVVSAITLGNLGQQVVIKSQHAYAGCHKVDRITVTGDEYREFNNQYIERDSIARVQMDSIKDTPGISIEQLLERAGFSG